MSSLGTPWQICIWSSVQSSLPVYFLLIKISSSQAAHLAACREVWLPVEAGCGEGAPKMVFLKVEKSSPYFSRFQVRSWQPEAPKMLGKSGFWPVQHWRG